jgi:cytochrome P450
MPIDLKSAPLTPLADAPVSPPRQAAERDAPNGTRVTPPSSPALAAGQRTSPRTPARRGSAEAATLLNRLPRDARFPIYARIREHGAIYLTNWPGLGRGYFVMRHAAALTMLKDGRFVKNPPSRWVEGDSIGPLRGFGIDLLESDPPDHTRLRKLVGKAFTSRIVERLEGRIESLAHELLDKHLPTGEIELVRDYAAVIPIKIITGLLGLEIANLEAFRQFIYALTFSMPANGQMASVSDAKTQFTKYLATVFEQRRREPRDDLITALVQAEQDGGRLSSDELIGMVYLLLIAGYVTTVNSIANGTLALLRNGEQMELLRGDRSLYPTAVEELLRYEGPLELSTTHFASADIEVDGTLIPYSAPVRFVWPSINRDPEAFERPEVLDLTRDPCPHLAFGHGIHFCLGAPLARLEVRIALRALIERAPALRLAGGRAEPWLSNPLLRGPERLPLRF